MTIPASEDPTPTSPQPPCPAAPLPVPQHPDVASLPHASHPSPSQEPLAVPQHPDVASLPHASHPSPSQEPLPLPPVLDAASTRHGSLPPPPDGPLRVPQHADTPPTLVDEHGFTYLYACARACETREAGETGQDYLTVQTAPGTLAFVLCDGVSQSFCGDVAARLLGDALVDWLWHNAPSGCNVPAIAAAATTFLQDLTTPATEAVQRTPLPDALVPVIRTVLEQKRTIGSDAVFVAGRLDLPGPSHPQGRALFLWMGDARLRLFTAHQEVSRNLGGVFETKQRWSSRRGLVNPPLNLFAGPIGAGPHALTRILAYSDGLPSLDHLSTAPTPTALATLMAQADASSTSDDIALLDIRLPHPTPRSPDT